MRTHLLALLLGSVFFAVATANEKCNVLPGKQKDPCTYFDEDGKQRYVQDDEDLCKELSETCCWDGKKCHQRMVGTGEVPKKGKGNPFSRPAQKSVQGTLSRNLPFGGSCLPELPFPAACKYQRNEPYVLSPPTEVPYCVRLPCVLDRSEQLSLDNSHFGCGSKPGCYFDVELHEYRQAFGPAVLPGVPVCHFAIRNAVFHREAQKVVRNTGSWNPYFTNCLLKTFADEIEKGPEGCKLIPLLRAFKIYPKLAGWDGITSKECAYIDGCFSRATGCVYPVDINNIVVKSGQRFKFDRFEVIYGRPKCQHFNMENSYEILKSYHRCLSSGCSIDLDIVSKYYHYLYDIGNQMSVEDHWDYWDKALGGKLKPDNLDEGIHWEWDRSFKRKAPVEPPGPVFTPPPSPSSEIPFGFPGRRKRNTFSPPGITPSQQRCGFVYRAFGGRPCRPPQVPDFKSSTYCPYKPFHVPRFKKLKGSFKGCCDINYCYLSIRDIRKMHSGPAPYYTEWSAFSECDRSCGSGTQKRTRFCVSYDDSKCTASKEETRSCNNHPCPRWKPWTLWTPCPGICGIQQRYRDCIPKDGDCRGKAEETKRCRCSGR